MGDGLSSPAIFIEVLMKVCIVLKGHGAHTLYLGCYPSLESAIRFLSRDFNSDSSLEPVDPTSMPDVTFRNGEKFTIFIDTIPEEE